MREILFRGKRTDNGEWAYGCLLNKIYGARNPAIISDQGVNDDFNLDFEYTYVEEETIGQYTGLTDKNGKKIFEGDLLDGFSYPYVFEEDHNYFAEVVWFYDCYAFGLHTHKYPTSDVRGCSDGNCDYMEDFDSSEWEVIGNIYDNPELLERR